MSLGSIPYYYFVARPFEFVKEEQLMRDVVGASLLFAPHYSSEEIS
jgi:hypothetical protein